jgi:hypothetical protein
MKRSLLYADNHEEFQSSFPETPNTLQSYEPWPDYFLVVKSISCSAGLNLASTAFSQVHASIKSWVSRVPVQSHPRRNVLAGRTPQAHFSPSGVLFSAAALVQLHWPAGRARHEHRGPEILFSSSAFSHLQWRADSLPHEHFACLASRLSVPGSGRNLVGVRTANAFRGLAATGDWFTGHCATVILMSDREKAQRGQKMSWGTFVVLRRDLGRLLVLYPSRNWERTTWVAMKVMTGRI